MAAAAGSSTSTSASGGSSTDSPTSLSTQGVSASRAADILAAYDHVVGRFAPDVLSISLGTNDALAGQVVRADLPRYCQAVREIAADAGAVLVDHEPHWLDRFADEDPIA